MESIQDKMVPNQACEFLGVSVTNTPLASHLPPLAFQRLYVMGFDTDTDSSSILAVEDTLQHLCCEATVLTTDVAGVCCTKYNLQFIATTFCKGKGILFVAFKALNNMKNSDVSFHE